MIPVSPTQPDVSWLDALHWDAEGLVPAIAQEEGTGTVLMMAWMNRESLQQTVRRGEVVYWSRSRQRLWHKGEESGHVQKVKKIQLDCDGDVLLLTVEQVGGIACHTGRAHCFFRILEGDQWHESNPVLKDPREIYGV
ncbi:phosphoribosyl-AMP cyclohydrolase [Ferrovum myxofaciens]|jgi:phosphoribosyl-AMP cyclohydrolase|uniref:Phosphoribosyl-AMP cyclohydrolase n=1 Tax=Ferrovum myxofaciens TaxID=416213 RepID=A0A859A9S4_9PROT|nr:phosphoribosyl-AMP cyclohydrolase [Ferrovum myxofaciens]MBW8028852.1 phosphoribosyl-AMP cyclohydrolase [Ferrovum sp.]KXW59218.1 phosphoribosyl-AMP cyclohydrolase [Ferrovum myxofaciens]MBU6994797.1 phosphoribosyl-AMP cyclohydrolase [Ferrovum myxofaciens]NDU90103.1 phosphoribosyl-AMP cyclohydrolase [Ferrovum sp.]QKE38635.1 MAG: phosphoribosyl-AMP cyclohydrolase [Ferrovum myxofaciens]